MKNALIPMTAKTILHLAGEANLTYSLEVLRQKMLTPKQLVSTVYETEDDASKIYLGVKSNAATLKRRGVKVHYGVDATALSRHNIIGKRQFDWVQFNYPHHVTAPTNDFRSQRELIRGFFDQAKLVLKDDGVITVLLHKTYPFGKMDLHGDDDDDDDDDGEEEEEEEDDDDAAKEEEEEEEEDDDDAAAVAAAKEDLKGWNLKRCAKKSGLKLVSYTPFNFGDHELYRPKKGFGDNPSDDWNTGTSRLYHFKLKDPMSPNKESTSTPHHPTKRSGSDQH